MRPELEEPGAVVGKAAHSLAEEMLRIKEAGWYGLFGSVEDPKAVVFVAVGDEAKEFLVWLKSRGGGLHDEPMLSWLPTPSDTMVSE